MDLPNRKDFIIAKTLPEMPKLESKPVCHTLSNFFEISKVISFMMNLLVSASLILCVMTVKTLVVDLEE